MEQVRRVWDQKLEEVAVSALPEPVRMHPDTVRQLSAGQEDAGFPGGEEEDGLSAADAADGLAEPFRLTRSNSTMNRTLLKQLDF
jgi:hypothetical protein